MLSLQSVTFHEHDQLPINFHTFLVHWQSS